MTHISQDSYPNPSASDRKCSALPVLDELLENVLHQKKPYIRSSM